MKYVDLIIFDLDGTLVDSQKDIANAVNFTLRSLNLKEKNLREVISYIGTGMKDLMRKSLGTEDEELLKNGLSVFGEYYKKHYTDNSLLYPNVKDMLEHFKHKRKAIATNRNYESAGRILKALGVGDYFENIIGGDDARCIKPSSCPLNKIMKTLNMHKEKTIMVGDMDIDVLAGKKAGILTCAVTYGIGKREDIVKAEPNFLIDNMIELKNIIK